MSTIEVKDLGPVSRLSIELPESGVVVLSGRQGSGKSTILKGVGKALGGDARGLTPRDSAKRGSIEIGDAKLTVTKSRAATKGDLEVTGIESRLDIAALVDPGVSDPERADAARIKALIKLRNVKANPADYYKLAGGEDVFEELDVDTDTDDPVLLAKRVKSAFDARARKLERDGDEAKGKAAALKERIGDTKLMDPAPQEELRTKLDSASARLTELETIVKTAGEANVAKADAEESLAALPVVADEIETVKESLAAAKSEIAEADAQIDTWQRQAREARSEASALSSRLEALEASAKQRDALLKVIDSVIPQAPTLDAVEQAAREKTEAAEALESAAKMRDLIASDVQRRAHVKASKSAHEAAENLRDRGAETEDVLASLVPLGALRIEGGRLVVATDRSESEPYAELSHGERWKLAIDLATDELGDDGLLVVPQESWESLQPANKVLIDQHAKDCGVVILTAEVSDGELEASAA